MDRGEDGLGPNRERKTTLAAGEMGKRAEDRCAAAACWIEDRDGRGMSCAALRFSFGPCAMR